MEICYHTKNKKNGTHYGRIMCLKIKFRQVIGEAWFFLDLREKEYLRMNEAGELISAEFELQL